MSKSFRIAGLFAAVLFSGPLFAQGMVCDVDTDGDVDRNDIQLIFAARNQPATGPDDPRDADGDGTITVLDGRQCVLQCTLPNCAEPPSNIAPVANAGSDQTVSLNDVVTLDGSGSSDADGDPLTFSWAILSAPAGSTAALSDPASVMPMFLADRAGDYLIQLVVNDGAAMSPPDEVVVITAPGNTAPVADAGPDQSVQLGNTVTLNGSASFDSDGDLLTFFWTLSSTPAGSAAVLSDPTAVMPTFNADLPGVYVAELVVDDGEAGSFPDTVTISTSNTPPVADAGPDQTVDLFDLVQLNGSGSFDADANPLTYSWSISAAPAGSTAVLGNAQTALPTFVADVAGTYIVQLIVNDGAVDSDPDTVVISTANTQPVADAGPDQSAQVGDIVQLDGNASFDADGNPLTFAWSFTSRPAASSAFIVNPDSANASFEADEAGLFVVQLIVNDGTVNSDPDTTSITIQVAPNNPPVITSTPVVAATVGDLYTYDVDATDDDGDTLTYSLDIAPAGMTIDTASGLINWTPIAAQVGDNPVTVRVADGEGGFATQSFQVNVIDDNVAPVITSTPVTNATVDDPYTYDVEATDDNGDTLTYSLDVAPAGMTIDTASGLINWTPSDAQLGDNPVTVRVADDAGGFATQSFQVTVIDDNVAPVITSTPVTNAIVDDPYTYDVEATDDNGDTLTYSLDIAPAGMTIDTASGLINWTPSDAQLGDNPVTVRVADGEGGFATQSFQVTVIDDNVAPVITSTPVTNATVNDPYTYDVEATDDNGDTLTYSLDIAPAGMTIDTATGLINWTPIAAQVGDNPVTVRVADGEGGLPRRVSRSS